MFLSFFVLVYLFSESRVGILCVSTKTSKQAYITLAENVIYTIYMMLCSQQRIRSSGFISNGSTEIFCIAKD